MAVQDVDVANVTNGSVAFCSQTGAEAWAILGASLSNFFFLLAVVNCTVQTPQESAGVEALYWQIFMRLDLRDERRFENEPRQRRVPLQAR